MSPLRSFRTAPLFATTVSMSAVLALSLLVCAPTVSLAGQWWVPDDAPTIAAGIDSAAYGDTVLVRSGTYLEYDIVVKSRILLRGESGNPSDTTVDAGGLGRIFYCAGVDSTSIIGFTITGGNTSGVGAGMYCEDCTGILVADCAFVGNSADGDGGGLYDDDSTVTVERCSFVGNSSGAGVGGAVFAEGVQGERVYSSCTFDSNDAMGGGGAVFLNDVSATITGCLFIENETSTGVGGGLYLYDGASPELTNVAFSGNRAGRCVGSGIACEDGSFPTLGNTIIAFGGAGEPVYCDGSSGATLACCDVYGNAGGDYVGCLEGQSGVDGNISQDPMFCGDGEPDQPYALRADSPCAAHNNPACGQIGALGVGCESILTWDGGGDGHTWEDPYNWDPDRVPGPDDHARILLDGTYSVDVNSESEIWALTHGAQSGTQTLDIESGLLAVTHGASNTSAVIVRSGAALEARQGDDPCVITNQGDASFTLDDGDLVGTGSFENIGSFFKIGPATSHVLLMLENGIGNRARAVGTIGAEAGTLSLEGEVSNEGRVNVNSGATAVVSQHFVRDGKDRQSPGTFNNRGTVMVAPDGTFSADATVITNEADGVVTLDDGDLTGTGTFVNRGLLRKIGPATSHVLLMLENGIGDRARAVGTIGAEAGTLSLEGETNSAGRVNVNSGATAVVSQHFVGREPRVGSFHSEGTVSVAAGGTFATAGSGAVTTSGTFEVFGSATVAAGGSFMNTGLATVELGGVFLASGSTTNDDEGVFTNAGATRIPAGGQVINRGFFDHQENALLGGGGTFDTSDGTTPLKGVIAPGDSPGILTFIGDFVQTASSEISFEIGGYDPGGEHDQLNITGSAVFAGAAGLSFLGGFEPVEGDSFVVIVQGEPGRPLTGGRDGVDFDCFWGLGVSDSLYMEPVQRPASFLFRAVGGTTGNAPPVAVADSASAYGPAPITIRVLANDFDPDLDELRVLLLLTDGTQGAAYIDSGDTTVTYVPPPGFDGTDSFSYVITDCQGDVDTAAVTIQGTAAPRIWRVPEDAPTIQAGIDSAAVGETVLVACGTYYESDISVGPGIVLRSETGEPDCVVIIASGRAGRGFYCVDVDSTTVIVGFTVTGGSSELSGGGMYCLRSTPVVRKCAFAGNAAAVAGGGVACDDNSSPTFVDCEISANSAGSGGGVSCGTGSSPSLIRCLLVGNTASTEGGGVACDASSSPHLANCTLAGNSGPQGGGMSIADGSAPDLDNTIIAFSALGEAVSCGGEGGPALACCDVYGNAGGDWVGCIADQFGVNGNFSADPEFCEPDSAEYFLGPDSPCADAPGCGLVGALGPGCDAEPDIDVLPSSFAFELAVGDAVSGVLEISNGGRLDLSWLIREEEGVAETKLRFRERSVVAAVPSLSRVSRVRAGLSEPPAVHLELKKGQPDPRAGGRNARGAGGPDAFGYRWIDSDEPGGPSFTWQDVSESGTGVGTPALLPDDDFVEVQLPFPFPFYGAHKTLVRISSNGYLTFGPVGEDYSNDPIPDPWDPNDLIAVLWDDLRPELGGAIHYHHDPVSNTFTVQYTDVYEYFGGGPHTFQVVLSPNGTVLFKYGEIRFPSTGATIGIENAGGSAGLQVAFNADYVHSGLAVRIEDPAPWLTEDPPSATIQQGDSRSVEIRVDAGGLTPGVYLADLVIESNDPDESVVTIPVSLNIVATGIDDPAPSTYALYGNFPNPFNPITHIRYGLPAAGSVGLRIYDLSGRLVRELVPDVWHDPGRHEARWEGRDDSGRAVGSGVYFYRLEAGGRVLERKMVLLK